MLPAREEMLGQLDSRVDAELMRRDAKERFELADEVKG